MLIHLGILEMPFFEKYVLCSTIFSFEYHVFFNFIIIFKKINKFLSRHDITYTHSVVQFNEISRFLSLLKPKYWITSVFLRQHVQFMNKIFTPPFPSVRAKTGLECQYMYLNYKRVFNSYPDYFTNTMQKIF